MSDQTSARAVADAVLYEGLLLYPYTPSALKNQRPWQFGVVMPQRYADRSEPTALETQIVVLPDREDARVEVTARFLQIADKPVERKVALTAGVPGKPAAVPFSYEALRGTLTLRSDRDESAYRLTIRLENQASTDPQATRNEALRTALVGAHAIVTACGARFASLLDPPAACQEAVARCRNERLFPVLVGDCSDPHTATTMLAAPIILYDFPAIAQESRGHTLDATEIDELLLLSVASLTEDEKREARAAHPLARGLVDRADRLDAKTVSLLHGRLSGPQETPGEESLKVNGTLVRRGSRVRVEPRGRADVWDSFVSGMVGRVCAVHTDLEGRRYVGVVFDGDPASDAHEWYGRAFFYGPDEVQPVGNLRG